MAKLEPLEIDLKAGPVLAELIRRQRYIEELEAEVERLGGEVDSDRVDPLYHLRIDGGG